MSEHGPLYDLAAATLSLLTEGFVAAEIDLPTRRTVIPGPLSVWDCEQATVSIVRVAVGIPGRELGAPVQNCPAVRFTTVRVEVVRCTPGLDDDGEPPSAAQLDASARVLLRDLATLDKVTAGWPGRAEFGGRGAPVAFGGAVPVQPEGGYAASRVDFDVSLLTLPA